MFKILTKPLKKTLKKIKKYLLPKIKKTACMSEQDKVQKTRGKSLKKDKNGEYNILSIYFKVGVFFYDIFCFQNN